MKQTTGDLVRKRSCVCQCVCERQLPEMRLGQCHD